MRRSDGLRNAGVAPLTGGEAIYTSSVGNPASAAALKPPRLYTSAYPMSLSVLPARAERPPDAQ